MDGIESNAAQTPARDGVCAGDHTVPICCCESRWRSAVRVRPRRFRPRREPLRLSGVARRHGATIKLDLVANQQRPPRSAKRLLPSVSHSIGSAIASVCGNHAVVGGRELARDNVLWRTRRRLASGVIV